MRKLQLHDSLSLSPSQKEKKRKEKKSPVNTERDYVLTLSGKIQTFFKSNSIFSSFFKIRFHQLSLLSNYVINNVSRSFSCAVTHNPSCDCYSLLVCRDSCELRLLRTLTESKRCRLLYPRFLWASGCD